MAGKRASKQMDKWKQKSQTGKTHSFAHLGPLAILGPLEFRAAWEYHFTYFLS